MPAGVGKQQSRSPPVPSRSLYGLCHETKEAAQAGEETLMGTYSSVGFLLRRGTSKTTKIRRDSDGQFGGTQTEHWDDRLDANVVPESVEIKVAVGGDK